MVSRDGSTKPGRELLELMRAEYAKRNSRTGVRKGADMASNLLDRHSSDPDRIPVAITGDWLRSIRRYFIIIGFGNLAWEFAQLPLYTIWYEAGIWENAFAAIHCTGGDLLIASSALFGTLLVIGDSRWPHARFRPVAWMTVLSGLTYTIFSEWLNTEIRGSWAYVDFMPTLPLIGTGVAPFLQWIIIPSAAFWWVRRSVGAAGAHQQGCVAERVPRE